MAVRAARSASRASLISKRPNLHAASGTLRVLLVRHAESENNVLMRGAASMRKFEDARSIDPNLSPRGVEQAASLAKLLEETPELFQLTQKGAEMNTLYCSPMRRSMQTAAPVGLALGMSPEIMVEVHETGGIYHERTEGSSTLLDENEEGHASGGLGRAAISEEFPSFKIPANCYKSGWWFGDREDVQAAEKRAAMVARKLWTDASRCHALRIVCIVSHGDFMARLMRELLGTPVNFNHHNTGMTCVDLPANERLGVTVHYINRVPVNPEGASVFSSGEDVTIHTA